jgi:tetratricopeptide (TPR) repeat protein
MGLLAFAFLPALAQTTNPAPKGSTGKIHGHVINPTGAPQSGGTVTLAGFGKTAPGANLQTELESKGVFQVDANGDYAGEAAPGIYTIEYRAADSKPEQITDKFDNVKVLAGQDTLLDIDMSRKEYVDKLPADQQKQLVELKKHNTEAMKTNEVIRHINDDLKLVSQDFKDADNARATAAQALGSGASKTDIDAKEAEIKTAKFTDAETLMLKDTAAKPDSSILWAQLGQAQLGLAQLSAVDDRPAKYAQAEATYKKVLELEAASKKPNPQAQGAANAGLGEIYARTGKVPEANAAFDAAAKINPPQAATYLKNEAVIFFQTGNSVAQVAAADEAIAIDPKGQPILYYLKGQGLVQNATVDTKTGKYILPPGCAEAYQMYLQLAPAGPLATEVKGILAQAAGVKAPK